ncbi:hypothetical protein N7463_000343 [Penicillium fimorum]|uniref:Uncharacterized protein n=1 Tax=Penicillium fimorum TaxID=1882269 RepID=A0A9W9Y441_9EURO|nr:hypothetical protein N7463_000343 [Penicillium fimorum]
MQDEQFALFALFTREFGMTLEKEEQGLLIKCAAWIGEGRHLDLLDSILESGFDPSMTDSPPLKKWPAPCSPDWISEEFTQDPFFLEYLATLLKACPGECKIYGALVAYIDEQPGFAGSTPLQDAILTQSIGSVRLILSKIDRLDDNRNFLGQTPLHLATTDPELFGILLDAGYDMNGTDRWGITPLMYAAAMGIEQVVKMLVSKGADLSAPCEHLNRDFVHYASARGHWGLLLEIADTIQSFHDEESFQNYVSSCIFDLIFSTPWEENSRTTYFCRLLELSDDVNFTIEDLWTGTNNNNLLHYSRQPTDVQTLVRCGFRGFNQPNSRGQLPIFSIVQRVSNVDLTRCCLKNGIDVNHIDRDGRTVLFMLLPKLSSLTGATWDVIDSIKLCLAWGLDISLSDGCICPCLSHGCDTSSAFNLNFKSTIFRDLPSFVWAFEWLSLIEEFCSYESSKATLLSFIRRKYSEVIEITHFCCHGGYGVRTSPHWDYSSRIAPDDVDEILDEEEELIDRLEAVMQLHTSSNIQTLKSQLMMLLKEGYDKQFDEFENQRKRKAENLREQPKYDAIHKSDSFQNAVGLTNFQYSLVHSMAQYAFWLQHEHFRSKNCSPSVPVKDGWYERRLSWYTELMSIMQVPVQQIVQMMKEIHVTESRSEGIDRNDTSDQFYASIFRILSLSGNMGANI